MKIIFLVLSLCFFAFIIPKINTFNISDDNKFLLGALSAIPMLVGFYRIVNKLQTN